MQMDKELPCPWLRAYLPEHRVSLHAFIMGVHPEVGANSGIQTLPIEIMDEIFSYFLKPKKYRFTGETTPWNQESPYDNSSGWCMTINIDPLSGIVSGKGTNIGMEAIKEYTGTIHREKFNVLVNFPETDQASTYIGTIIPDKKCKNGGKYSGGGKCELLITIVNPGRTSGIKGDWKKVIGVYEEEYY
jgi:hypothetical protein